MSTENGRPSGRPSLQPNTGKSSRPNQAAVEQAMFAAKDALANRGFEEGVVERICAAVAHEIASGMMDAQLKEVPAIFAEIAQWDGEEPLSPEATGHIEEIQKLTQDMAEFYAAIAEDAAGYLAAKARGFTAYHRAS